MIHPRLFSAFFSTRRRTALAAVLTGVALALPACTTIGAGSGMLEPGNSPVTFSWTSKDGGISGTMSASMGPARAPGAAAASGDAFSGPFLQVTSSTRSDQYEPLWSGWTRGWNDWGYWGMFPESQFTTHYSGKVIANLQGPGTQRLRCRFHLNTPSAGMAGGGQGECQFNGGRSVNAVFPRS